MGESIFQRSPSYVVHEQSKALHQPRKEQHGTHSIRDTPEAELDQKRKVAEIKRTAKGTWRGSMVAKEQRRPDCLQKTRQGGRNRATCPDRIADAVAPGSFENHWIAGAKVHRIGIVARRRFRTGVGGIAIRGRLRRIIPVVRVTRAV
jgi:hypothetical protein